MAMAVLGVNALANTAATTPRPPALSVEQKGYADAKASVYAAEARMAYLSALRVLAVAHVNQPPTSGDPAIREAVRGQVGAFTQEIERYSAEWKAQPIHAALARLDGMLSAGQTAGLGAARREVETAQTQLVGWRQGADAALNRSVSQLLAAGIPLPNASAKPPQLVIYRPANFNGSRIALRVFINEVPAVILDNNQYAAISVPPGNYTLRVDAFSAMNQTAEVSVGMGDVGYFETAVAESTWSLRSKLQPTPEAAAKSVLTQMSGTPLPTWVPVKPRPGAGGT